MRPPDWASERGDSAERGPADRARWARDDLRQRLDRLPDGHPSAPEYEELPGSGEPGSGQPAEYGELENAELENAEPENAELDNGELDNGELDNGEPAEGGDEGGGGRPAGRRAGDAGARTAAGTGGLASSQQPYRPWFTSGESPAPWFTADPGG
jgi:hypothetical protein